VERISYLLASVQRSLFPALREEVGELSAKDRRFVVTLEFLEIEKYIGRRSWLGRTPKNRRMLARAFVAKAFYNIPTTGALLERLRVDKSVRRVCGWERKNQVPSESTFSRAFDEFAQSGLADRVHESAVKEYVGDDVVWHVSRDSTAIDARERPVKKDAKIVASKPKRKRGRPKKGEVRPAPEKTRLERQREWSLGECLGDLPTACDIGSKRNSKGHMISWTGYKFHADVADGGIPLSGITTSASVHDSQVAIPLMKMTSDRVESFYDLMDPAYDAELIRQSSIQAVSESRNGFRIWSAHKWEDAHCRNNEGEQQSGHSICGEDASICRGHIGHGGHARHALQHVVHHAHQRCLRSSALKPI